MHTAELRPQERQFIHLLEQGELSLEQTVTLVCVWEELVQDLERLEKILARPLERMRGEAIEDVAGMELEDEEEDSCLIWFMAGMAGQIQH